ncbi:MAG: ABC-2 family transporter protein [Anaerolineales bacterium]
MSSLRILRRYASLYGDCLRMRIKEQLEYRLGFAVGLVAIFVVQGASLATIWVTMRQVPSLNGWSLPEVLLIYGLVIFSRACTQMFTERIWVLGYIIRFGEFDRLLVRPINPLFHLLSDGFNTEAVGTFLLGGALIITTGRELGIFASLFNIVYLAVAIASGAVIFFAINLITGVSAFWIIDSIPVMGAVFENYLFVHYPITIFPKAVQVLLTWVIPYAFASFYPASFLLGRDIGPLVWISPLIAAGLLALGYRFWLAGLRRYESTGA